MLSSSAEGTAGAMAAIAAARGGARTLVVEQYGHLDGTAVYGIPFLGILSGDGTRVNRGMVTELLDRALPGRILFRSCRRGLLAHAGKARLLWIQFDAL